ncbi:MAG TPA: methionine biosynthesis protein MetW [Thermodesulfobacteriota bacterium]|nr:methionine biosynthesis protein MetW [Thermodesulfobacteriota bacterium]
MATAWQTAMIPNGIRFDHQIIYQIVERGARVLDLGCGSGDLLYLLAREKGAKVQGIEVNDSAIYECVKKGLSVFHGDIESGLAEYPDRSFDYVILNQSMQEVKKIDWLIDEALRIGGKIIVGFPNFAFIQARIMLFFRGKAPITSSLPYRWHDTPNVRFLSISDFRDFCREKNLKVLEACYLGRQRNIPLWPNLFALNAIFVVTK